MGYLNTRYCMKAVLAQSMGHCSQMQPSALCHLSCQDWLSSGFHVSSTYQESAVIVQVCWTWAYFVEVVGLLVAVGVRYAALKVQQLRRAIHEERYLVGRQLNNLVPTPVNS